jgi:hypothetical protein
LPVKFRCNFGTGLIFCFFFIKKKERGIKSKPANT